MKLRVSRRRLGVLAVMVLAAALWYWLDYSATPRYHGWTADRWFKEYYRNRDPAAHQSAEEALVKLGTNALPCLASVALDPSEDSYLSTRLAMLLDALPEVLHVPKSSSHEVIRSYAFVAVSAIRPKAVEILPLVETALNSDDAQEHRQALALLSTGLQTGGDLVPSLRRALKFTDNDSLQLALNMLAVSKKSAAPALPEVMVVLTNEHGSAQVRRTAARVLGNIGFDAAPAAPLLADRLAQEGDWYNRLAMASSLCRIQTPSAEALGFFTNALKDNPVRGRGRGSALLLELNLIGPPARPVAPALIQALDGTNLEILAGAPAALRSLGAPTADYLPKLVEKLDSDRSPTRLTAAAAILDCEPLDTNVQLALVTLVRKCPERAPDAVTQLARARPLIADAAPLFTNLLTAPDPRIQRAAEAALKKLEPEAAHK